MSVPRSLTLSGISSKRFGPFAVTLTSVAILAPAVRWLARVAGKWVINDAESRAIVESWFSTPSKATSFGLSWFPGRAFI